MLGASPHSHDAITNSSTLAVNRRTCPKRCVSQPVSGTEIAFATAKDVMTQVPCAGLTPMSPAMVGMDTFAIDESSTFRKVASDKATVPSTSWLPCSGPDWCAAGGAGRGDAAGAADASATAVELVMTWPSANDVHRQLLSRPHGRHARRAMTEVGRDDVVHHPVSRRRLRIEGLRRRRAHVAHRGERRAALLGDVDHDFHRQAHSQRMLRKLLSVQL